MKMIVNRCVIRLVSGAMLLVLPWGVQAHRAHVHGEGQMQVALEGETLDIMLTLPAMDVVGFEHRPSTGAQRDQVKQAMEHLGNAEQTLRLPAAARCDMTFAQISSELAEQAEAADHHGHGKDEHADFIAHYRFTCTQPQELVSVTVSLFEWLPAISLRTEWVTAQGAGAVRLSRRAATLALTDRR
jgi:hypothetical protein